MLKKILTTETCAICRQCCRFERYDIWEMPVFSLENLKIILRADPDKQFIPKNDGFIYRADTSGSPFDCPALAENGCMLGDDKPFDCRIWPFRVMDIGGRRAITLSYLCEEMFSRSLDKLVEFLKSGIADEIFAYADEHPDIVKPYYEGYPVLVFRSMYNNQCET